jgi:hypothetical protein
MMLLKIYAMVAQSDEERHGAPTNSDGWSKRVGTGVGPLPSLWDRYRMYGLILALVAAFVLIGLTIFHHLETP